MSNAELPVLATGPPEATAGRDALLLQGLRLERITIGWNVVEAAVGLGAALAAGSVALLAFGLDSIVETASGVIVLWRLERERREGASCGVAALDARAQRWVGACLLALAAWVALHGAFSLWRGARPEASPVGIGLTAVSMVVMLALARAKRRVATALGSGALEADAFQTTACWWLSIVTLAGIGLNAALGWWWADPLAALALVPIIGAEARRALRGEGCGCG